MPETITIHVPAEPLTAEESDRLHNFGIMYEILCEETGLDPCAGLDTLNELIRRAARPNSEERP